MADTATVPTYVAEIRQAAALMRRRAEVASSQCRTPWHEAPVDPRPDRGLFTADGGPIGVIAESSELPRLSEHIVSWHPGVALTLAGLLEGVAAREERWWATYAPCQPDCEACAPCYAEPGDEAFLAERIAQAYLGRLTADGGEVPSDG